MLTKTPWYHGTTRKMVVGFAGLFSNIFIQTKDAQGVTKKIVNVPLAYANKEKFIVRLQQDPNLNEDVQVSLPRMSFEIVGFEYDSNRQINKIQKSNIVKNDKSAYQYAPVPYNLSFNLYTFTRTQEDNLQILEQIVPYFTPEMNLSIKVLQNPDVVQDCNLIMNDVNIDDQYDGGFEDRRYIISTYTFTMQMNYYGPILGTSDPENHFESGAGVSVIKKVVTNLNQTKYTATVDPFIANSSDTHQILEGWSDRGGVDDFDTNVTL
jgi:T4-like virus Myoviridae tail sheath stabiliser